MEARLVRLKLPWISLLILTGLNLVNYLDRYVLSAVLTPIKQSLGLTDAELGKLSVSFMLGYFLTAPLFGYLGNHIKRKGLIVVGILVWCLGTYLSGYAHSFASLVVFRILVGLGEASYGTLSPTWISDSYAPDKRNQVLAYFYSAIPVGSALGFLIGGLIATHYGWRMVFFVAPVPGVFLVSLLLLVEEPKRGASEPNETGITTLNKKNFFSTYRELFNYPSYLLLTAGYTAQTFALGAFAFWGPTFLHRIRGISLNEADRFFGISLVLTGLIATLLGGFWGTSWIKKNPNAYANLLALSAICAIPVSYFAFVAVNPFFFSASFVLAMFFIFLSTGPTNTLILETVPVPMRASAVAFSIFIIHLLGDLTSPYLVGKLSDITGNLQQAVLYLLPGALALCAVFWSLLSYTFRSHTVKPFN
jgi:MFS family permease